MTTIAENLAAVRERIHRACSKAGRDPLHVKLVGVTKTVAAERVREGVLAGITSLGENYIQEALKKQELLDDLAVEWHFIGHLQSNKAGTAAEGFHWIHTVDRPKLAKELDRQARKRGRRLSVLLQVNVGEEATKSGCSIEEAPSLLEKTASLEALTVRGLMTLPPYLEDAEAVRPYFQELRRLMERLRRDAPHPGVFDQLSMGMSHDFEVAIEEGATMVRVGTDLFGRRPR